MHHLKYKNDRYERIDNSKPIRSKVAIWIFWCAVLYLASIVIEGPLRYALTVINAANILYVRDGFVLLGIVLGFRLAVQDFRKLMTPLFCLSSLLLAYFIYGILVGDVPLFSGLFGLKIYATTLLGVSLYFVQIKYGEKFYRLTTFFLLTTITGVLLNYLIGDLPWEGQEFESVFGTGTTTRTWWENDGTSRLPGFARASFDAATLIGISYAYVASYQSRTISFCLGLAALFAVHLTTSKGMVFALILLLAWNSIGSSKIKLSLGKIIIFSLLMLSIFMPLLSCIYKFQFSDFYGMSSSLFSFADRIVNTWPQSCSMLSNPLAWIMGNGIGSIGVPLAYESNALMNTSADNFFVYLYISGGVLWFLLVLMTVYRLLNINNYCDVGVLLTERIYSLLIIIFGYGITSNMQEQPFYTVYAGILLAMAWMPKVRQLKIISY